MRILVTGGSGYIGFHVIDLALRNGHSVISLDTAAPAIDFEGQFTFIQGSILDHSVLKEISNTVKLDAIVHLAAEKSIEKSQNFPEIFVSTNVLGTRLLADFALAENVEHFIFTSTAAVYGEVEDNVKLSEKSRLNPANTYGKTKVESENILTETFAGTSTRLSILRLFNVAGAAKNFVPKFYDVNIFPQIIKSIHNDSIFKLFGKSLITKDGSAVRDYVHVENVAQIILGLLRNVASKPDYSVFNVCSGIGTSNIDVIRSLETASEKQVLLSIMPAREGELQYVVGDSTRLISAFPDTNIARLNEIASSAWTSHAPLEMGKNDG